MNTALAIRALSLYAPIAASVLLWLTRPVPRRTGPALLLSILWTLPTLIAVQTLNQHAGWWTFHTEGPTLRGLPVELYLGWAALWSAVPVLAFRRTWVAVASMLALDLIIMPLCAPVVVLGPRWLIGEATAALTVLLPSLLIANWTRNNLHLNRRATAQLLTAAGLFLYLPPEILFALRGGAWHYHWSMQLVLLLALPGITAVQEFAQRGRGTPIPYDPPQTLVTTGIYRYVANPMQLSCTLVLLVWGIILHAPWLAAGAFLSAVYSVGIARWDEREDLATRFGQPWKLYRAEVHDWRPRLTPFISVPARIYIAQTCGPCSELRLWLESRRPSGLEILPAESHPESLRRIRYEDADYQANGLEALARALEHIHLSWALLAAATRLPVLKWVLQTIADASGFGERVIGTDAGHTNSTCRKAGRRRPSGWFAALG
jgi:protein-S-isoprenylcysteine O-methyltransferase Ste14